MTSFWEAKTSTASYRSHLNTYRIVHHFFNNETIQAEVKSPPAHKSLSLVRLQRYSKRMSVISRPRHATFASRGPFCDTHLSSSSLLQSPNLNTIQILKHQNTVEVSIYDIQLQLLWRHLFFLINLRNILSCAQLNFQHLNYI